MDVLTVKNLKTYFYCEKDKPPIKAVDDVSLRAERGKLTALIGESGSGKSVTSLSIMNLVDRPGRIVDGEVLLNGERISGLSQKQMCRIRGKEISMIFQDPSAAMNPIVKVKKQLLEAIRIHQSISKRQALSRCRQMIEKVGLHHPDAILESYPFELSGGMCQRVMVAMALLSDPAILIADEPTSSLDLTVQASVLELLRELKEAGMSILLVTHDLGWWRRWRTMCM